MTNTDLALTCIAGAAMLVGGACALLSQTAYVKARPGLANLIRGAENAAGRLALIVPPGATVAQVEAAIASEAAQVMANYSQSAKAANATPAQVQGEIAGALGKMRPALVTQPAVAPPALQTINHPAAMSLSPTATVPAEPILPTMAP